MEYRDFGWALEQMKMGKTVVRRAWIPDVIYLFLVQVKAPYIMMLTGTGQLIPWLASITDMLAEDWELFDSDTEEVY